MVRHARLLIPLLIAATGCNLPPLWFNRGPAREQQAWAEVLDPYPDDDAGPEVVGGRPRMFDKQRSETQRVRSWPLGYENR